MRVVITVIAILWCLMITLTCAAAVVFVVFGYWQ